MQSEEGEKRMKKMRATLDGLIDEDLDESGKDDQSELERFKETKIEL